MHIGSFFMHIFSATTHRKKTCHAYPPQNTKCLVCHVSAQECCDITPICARASQAPGLHPGYLRDIQCAYWFILHAYLFCYHPQKKKLAMPIHLKTLNVLSATSQPRNAATSHLYAHELLRHLGCTRAT